MQNFNYKTSSSLYPTKNKRITMILGIRQTISSSRVCKTNVNMIRVRCKINIYLKIVYELYLYDESKPTFT